MKTCKKCKETKDFSEFNRANASKDGMQRHCRACDAMATSGLRFKMSYGPDGDVRMSPQT